MTILIRLKEKLDSISAPSPIIWLQEAAGLMRGNESLPDLIEYSLASHLSQIYEFGEVQGRPTGVSITVIAGENYTLNLVPMRPRPPQLVSSLAGPLLVMSLNSSWKLAKYSPSKSWAKDVFDPELYITLDSALDISPLDPTLVDPSSAVFDFLISEPEIFLHLVPALSRKAVNPLVWTFDLGNSGKALSTRAQSSDDTLAVCCIRAAADLGGTGFVAPLKKIASNSKSHFVRWEALQSLINIDYNEGLAALKAAAAGDIHPEIRESGTAALKNLIDDFTDAN